LYDVDYHQDIHSDDLRTDIRKIDNPNIKEAMEVLAQYSDAHYKQRLNDDAAKYNLANPTIKKKPIKYAGFIDKFKRSISNIITNLEKKMTNIMKDLSPEQIKLLATNLSKIDSFEFNVFELDSLIQKKTLHFVSNQILTKYGFFKEVTTDKKFSNFITEIIDGYSRDVQYHNDLHATDVVQTTFVLIEKGNLVSVRITYLLNF
jgi:hypothetical protein